MMTRVLSTGRREESFDAERATFEWHFMNVQGIVYHPIPALYCKRILYVRL